MLFEPPPRGPGEPPRGREDPQPRRPDEVYCPNCGALNRRNYAFCVNCGTNLATALAGRDVAGLALGGTYPVRFDVRYPERLSRLQIFVKLLAAIPHCF